MLEFADEVAALVASRGPEDLAANREFRRALERLHAAWEKATAELAAA